MPAAVCCRNSIFGSHISDADNTFSIVSEGREYKITFFVWKYIAYCSILLYLQGIG